MEPVSVFPLATVTNFNHHGRVMKMCLSYLTLPRLAAVAVLAISAPALSAQNVTTDPVGAVVIPLKAGSDTRISLPLHRPVALEALVGSISGNVITLQSPVSMTASQYVYASPAQTDTFYVQFTSGNREGMFYTVTANDATTLTINPNNDVNLDNNVAPGDTVRVIPYWTLNTLFPNGQGLYASPTLVPVSSILLPQLATAGINLPANTSYFYYSGNSFGGPGWKKSGDLTHFYPDLTFPPDAFFIVRITTGNPDTQLVLTGDVPMSAQAIIVNDLNPSLKQDNAVAIPVPVPVTFGSSGLFPNIVSGSPTLVPTDSVLLYDPTAGGFNKPSSATYFYYTGSSFGGPGWRKSGDLTTIRNSDILFQPGGAFILRRAARATPGSNIWTFVPPYLPAPPP